MTGFHYVYMLSDVATHTHHYVGMTEDLKSHLAKHNSGQVPHTAKFMPWKMETYIAFETLSKAQSFERYLKSGSGHAFANRHF